MTCIRRELGNLSFKVQLRDTPRATGVCQLSPTCCHHSHCSRPDTSQVLRASFPHSALLAEYLGKGGGIGQPEDPSATTQINIKLHSAVASLFAADSKTVRTSVQTIRDLILLTAAVASVDHRQSLCFHRHARFRSIRGEFMAVAAQRICRLELLATQVRVSLPDLVVEGAQSRGSLHPRILQRRQLPEPADAASAADADAVAVPGAAAAAAATGSSAEDEKHELKDGSNDEKKRSPHHHHAAAVVKKQTKPLLYLQFEIRPAERKTYFVAEVPAPCISFQLLDS